jgi:putative spermidine/putrescine transport system permease protein
VTASTAPPRRRRGLPQGLRTLLLLAPALVVVLVLFGGGVVMGVLASFGYQPFLPGSELSLDAYRGLVDDVEVRRSLLLTFRIALLSTVVSAVLAVAAALLPARHPAGPAARRAGLPAEPARAAPGRRAAMLLLLSQSGLLSRVLFALGLVDAPAGAPCSPTTPWAGRSWRSTSGRRCRSSASSCSRPCPWRPRPRGRRTLARRRRVVALPLRRPAAHRPAVLSTSIIVFAFTFGSYEVPLLLGQPSPRRCRSSPTRRTPTPT